MLWTDSVRLIPVYVRFGAAGYVIKYGKIRINGYRMVIGKFDRHYSDNRRTGNATRQSNRRVRRFFHKPVIVSQKDNNITTDSNDIATKLQTNKYTTK